MGISLVRVTCGFFLAGAIAIPLGILMGYYIGLKKKILENQPDRFL